MSDSEAPVDFRDLIAQPGSDFPDRPEFPAQKYFYGVLTSMAATSSSQKQTPGYHFGIRATDFGKDVTDAEKKAFSDAGVTLADYEIGTDFWVTPKAMPMLHHFLETLGFDRNLSIREKLALDENGIPTAETQDRIRGKQVIFKTPAKGNNDRVYMANVDAVMGVQQK